VALHHLRHPRSVADEQVVGKRHRQRLARREVAPQPDGVGEAARLVLHGEVDACRHARRAGE